MTFRCLLVGLFFLLTIGCSGEFDAAEVPTDVDSGVACDPTKVDITAEGCACATLGEAQVCYHGQPGANSACATPGGQVCESTPAGNRWGECVGGSTPSAESCFDLVDNDCNGVVDDLCACTNAVDLCIRDGQMLSATQPTLLVDDLAPKMGDTIHIFLVSASPLDATSIEVGDVCKGIPGTECAAGDGCAGWHALVHTVDVTTANGFAPGETATVGVSYHVSASGLCDGATVNKHVYVQ